MPTTPTPTPMEWTVNDSTEPFTHTATETARNISAASSGVTDGFASMTGLGPSAAIVVAIVATIVILVAASSQERYERLAMVAQGIVRTLELALFGLGGVVVLAVISSPAYFVASQPAATRTEWLTYAGYGLAAIIGLAAFGWVVEKVWARLMERHAEYVEAQPAPEPEPEASGGEAGD